METGIHFSVSGLCWTTPFNSPRLQRVPIFSILPFPINAALFHAKVERNRWIPAGEKNSFFTGRLSKSLKKYVKPYPASSYRQQFWKKKSGTWIMKRVLVIKRYQCSSVFMNPCDSLLPIVREQFKPFKEEYLCSSWFWNYIKVHKNRRWLRFIRKETLGRKITGQTISSKEQ